MTTAAADRARRRRRGGRARRRARSSCSRGGGGGRPARHARGARARRARSSTRTCRPTRTARRTRASRALAGGFPAIARLRDSLAGAVAPGAFTLERDVRPWLGDEAAYAAVSPARHAAARRGRRPRRGRGARGAHRQPRHRGHVPRRAACSSAGPTSLAFVRDDVLAVGTDRGRARRRIDRAQGEGDALAGATALRAGDGGPARRPRRSTSTPPPQGVREVLAARDGLARRGRRAARPPGARGRCRVASAAEADGLRIARAAGRAAGPSDASFTPVARRARARGGRGLPRRRRRVSRLIRVLGRARRPARPSTRCARLLADNAGVDLDGDLLAPLSGEVALAVTTGAEDPGGSSGGAPVVTLKAQTADAEGTRGGARAAPGPARHAARPARERAGVPAR